MNDGRTILETTDAKAAVIEEIFVAYRHTGAAYRKAQGIEQRNRIDGLRHTLDLALRQMSPLTDYHEDVWREVRTHFRSRKR